MPMGAMSGGGGGGGGVTPSEEARVLAKRLTVLLVAEVLIIGAMFTVDIIWSILQGISVIVAYCAIRNANAFKPSFLQVYTLLTAIGATFIAIYLAIAASEFSKAPWVIFTICIMASGVIVLTLCAVTAWRLFKECLFCSPSLELAPLGGGAENMQGGGGRGDYANTYAGGGGGSYGQPRPEPPAGATVPPLGGFTPFQGQGQRLG